MKNPINTQINNPLMKIIIIFFAISIIAACKKNNNTSNNQNNPSSGNNQNNPSSLAIPTITPLSYLPAYPGSYWHYTVKNSNSVVTYTTSSSYVLDSVNNSSFMPPNYEKKMVPIYNGTTLWSSCRYAYYQTGNNSLIWIPENKDSLSVKGEKWETKKSIAQEKNLRLTLTRDSTVKIKGITYYPVIVTRDYIDLGGSIILLSDKYYAKNVGMINLRTYNNFIRSMSPMAYIPRDSAIEELELDNYFIHP